MSKRSDYAEERASYRNYRAWKSRLGRYPHWIRAYYDIARDHGLYPKQGKGVEYQAFRDAMEELFDEVEKLAQEYEEIGGDFPRRRRPSQ
jgi:hypothetical protein